jgi:ADP-heptose:LPS heptosyltransferase
MISKQIENAEIHFVIKKKHVSIAASNPYIHKIHILGDNINKLISELEEEQLDYIIDLHQNFRSNRIKRSLKIPSFSLNKLNFRKALLIFFKINRLPDSHVVDRYLETLSVFDVKNDGLGLDYFIPEKEVINIHELPEMFQKGFVAFVIAGTYNTKKLPLYKTIEICNQLDFPVILLGGKNEFNEGEQVAVRSKGNILNFAGKISLNQSASILREARLVLTNDTGLMHIAAAFKKKILSFWGNTVPEFGMYPYLPDRASEIIEIKNLKCRPCSKLGYQKCPKKHFKCMKNIDSSVAIQWINKNFN